MGRRILVTLLMLVNAICCFAMLPALGGSFTAFVVMTVAMCIFVTPAVIDGVGWIIHGKSYGLVGWLVTGGSEDG